MNLHHLKLFVHLSGTLNFSKSAEQCFVSVPTLSRIIKQLEQEVGGKLFDRGTRSVSLTASGEAYLQFALQVLADWVSLRQTIAHVSPTLTGKLTLFCSVTASQSHLPRLLSRLTQQHPGLELKLITGNYDNAQQQVLNGVADVAFAVNEVGLTTELVFQSIDYLPFSLITPKHQYSELHNTSRPFELLASVPIIIPESGPSRRLIYRYLAEHALRPKVYAEVAGHEAIISLVALGCGISFVPGVVVEHSNLAAKVDSSAFSAIKPFELGLIWLRERSANPLIQSILSLLVEEYQRPV